MTIRAAQITDLEALVEGNIRLAAETEAKALAPETVRRGVSLALEDPARARYWVAEADGGVAGMCMVTYEWSDWRCGWVWWLQSVYVWPAHRRQGIFRMLFEQVLAEGQDADIVGFRVYAEQQNHAAQGLYQSLGFDPAPYVMFDGWMTV